MRRLAFVLMLLVLAGNVGSQEARTRSPREGLQPFNDLVGTWRGTGTPAGSREQQRTGFWTESITCGWKFNGDDARIVFDIDKSKHIRRAELAFLPASDSYRLHLESVDRKTITLDGKLEGRNLVLTNEADDTRLVLTLLHDNRFLYRQEVRPGGKSLFVKTFQVGATKEGVPFATGGGQPECIVTGGLAKTPVMFEGKTYYVCCSGCRDEFIANPAKYVREAEAKKKAK